MAQLRLTVLQVHETLSLFDLSKMEKLPEDVNVESLQFDMGKNVVPSTREHLSRKSIMTTEDIFSTNHQAPLNAGKEPRIVSFFWVALLNESIQNYLDVLF